MDKQYPMSWWRDKSGTLANGAILVELAEVTAWLRHVGAGTLADVLEQIPPAVEGDS